MDTKTSRLGTYAALFAAIACQACSDADPGPAAPADAATTDALVDDVATDGPVDDVATDAPTDAATTDAPADLGKDDASEPRDAADSSTDADAAPRTCLEAAEHAARFTIEDPSTCVVAIYDVPARVSGLGWGRHGGPMRLDASNAAAPVLERFEIPAAARGTLTVKRKTLSIPSLPAKDFFWGQALDLPFHDWTALSYTGAGAAGELILLTPADAITRYRMIGLYGSAGLHLAGGEGGRLLYTGLSPLSTTAITGAREGALWAADTCAGATPGLHAVGGCAAPTKVATWRNGDSGPLARDPAGNVFAMLSKVDFTKPAESFYEARGFERSTVARGAPAASGTELFTLQATYVTAFAADGVRLYFQPNDAATYQALDVESVGYEVDATKETVTKKGAAAKFLSLTKPGTGVELFTDPAGRLWVAVKSGAGGGAGTETTTLFVLSRR
jgi:hypothetical protein